MSRTPQEEYRMLVALRDGAEFIFYQAEVTASVNEKIAKWKRPIKDEDREYHNKVMSEAQGALDALHWVGRRIEELEAKLMRKRG